MIDTLWIILTAILHASCQAAIVAILIAGIQLSVGRRLSPNWRIALWSLVIIRLITPPLPASQFSLLNLLRSPSPIPPSTTTDPQSTITFGIITDAPKPISHPSPTIAKPVAPALDWRPFAIGLWAVGTLALLLRMAISQATLFHRLRFSYPVEDLKTAKLLEQCRRTLRAPPVKCVEADWISAPALCGLFHHTLLLPTDFSDTLSNSDLQFILMHELIHARRRDLLLDHLIAFIVAFHWFNPAAWLAWQRIRTERELACDTQVLRFTQPTDRLHYGQTILNIFEKYSRRRTEILSVGIFGQRSSLHRRLLAIAQSPRPWRLQGLTASLFVVLILCVAFTSAQPRPTTSAASQPATAPSGMVVRNYDVHILLLKVPDFDDAREFNLNHSPTPVTATTRPSRAVPTTQQLAEKLIADIQSRIDPASWKSASITESDGKLLVTQTPANQDAIWKYLSSQMADRSTQITVETRLLRLSPAIVSRWKSLHPSKPLSTESLAFTKADVYELLRIFQTNPHSSQNTPPQLHVDWGSTLIIAPRLTLFNHQRAYCIFETTTAYVRDLHPSSTTHPSKSGFDPDIDHADSGIRLDMRTTVSPDRKSVTLELNDQQSDLLSLKAAPWPKAPRGRTDLTIQIPTERYDALNTSVNVPTDAYYITPATETFEPASTTPPDKLQTFIIIHPTILTNDPPHAMLDSTRPSHSPKPHA